MTRRHLIMAALVAIAAWFALFGDKTPSEGIAEPVARAASASARAAASTSPASETAPSSDKAKRDTVILALQKRDQLMSGSLSPADGSIGSAASVTARPDALFNSQSWTPPPRPAPPAPPAPPPSAPPLPFSYIGKKIEAGKWEVFLAHGDQNFVVREGAILEGTYRVDSITASVLTLTYLPLKQVQTITIGGID